MYHKKGISCYLSNCELIRKCLQPLLRELAHDFLTEEPHIQQLILLEIKFRFRKGVFLRNINVH
jgi:hypothetical protein